MKLTVEFELDESWKVRFPNNEEKLKNLIKPQLEGAKAKVVKNLDLHIIRGSMPVDKSTKHGWPIQYYICPHCECEYAIRLADNNCAECGTALNW